MKKFVAERIVSGKGWYWPTNSRKAHAYGQDNRTVCGRGFVFVLPDGLDPLDSPKSSADCAECRRRVDEALEVVG